MARCRRHREISDGIVLDYDATGHVMGIE
ncbi:MAG: DUF2283 domain-containing protein, partial [Verrucomicrobiota bacterium]